MISYDFGYRVATFPILDTHNQIIAQRIEVRDERARLEMEAAA